MSEKNYEDIQNKDDFIKYFEHINNHSDKIPNSNVHNSIISHMNQILEKLMGRKADDTFNEPFQPNEIIKAVKTLKNGKSAAGDLLSNEMFKYAFQF
jgi:replicative superfamily II helicase